MIKRIVKMTFKRGEIERFRALFSERCHEIRAFPGCESLELIQDIEDDRIFFTVSEWQGTVELENYRRSDLFRTTWSQTRTLFDSRPEAWSTKSQILIE